MLHASPPGRPGNVRVALAITLFLFVDGFDLFLLGKIAPAIAETYGRSPAAMELVFAFHQIGLALGAFTVPMIADRFGSRRVLVITAVLFGVGNVLSGFIADFTTFAIIRGLCGVFMAGAMPVGLALLSEHVPRARLGGILSIAMVGMSVGAAANSLVPAFLMDRFGWQSGFILGGLMPLLLIPLLLSSVPESSRFRQNISNASQDSFGQQLGALFAHGRATVTVLLWVILFLSMGQTALLAVWLPTFFQELGGVSIQDFAVVATLTAVGGALGTLAVGWLQDTFGKFVITALVLVGHGASLILLGVLRFGTWEFATVFVTWSFFQSAGIAGINLLLVRLYPVEIRATGSGWAAGMGRIAGALAPAAGTMLLVGGVSLSLALIWIAVPVFVAGLVIVPWLALSQPRELGGAALQP